jgi:hypothetical protein
MVCRGVEEVKSGLYFTSPKHSKTLKLRVESLAMRMLFWRRVVDFLFLCVFFLSRLLCWWGNVFGVRFQDGYTFSVMVKESSEVGYGCRCIILFSFVSHLTFLFSSSLFHCHFRSRVIVEKQETRSKAKDRVQNHARRKKKTFFPR